MDGGAQTHQSGSGGRSGVVGDNSELIGCCDIVAEAKGGESQLEQQPGRCSVQSRTEMLQRA